jgi:BirA family biotin operon repressor/biotin-[acetyl-CoA-carboxylase] ligase
LYKIPAKTLFIGKNLVFVPECHSTNSLASELTLSNPAALDGSVVITEHQTAGRGQRGNTWEAAAGENLTFSVILKPTWLAIKDQFYLNIFTSLAIHDMLSDKLNATLSIKWPNDILVEGKKLCGILIENQIQGGQVSRTIIGIGLNVNQSEFSAAGATSMKRNSGKVYDRQEVLEQLLAHLERRYLQLRSRHEAMLLEEYLRQLYWRNERHVFQSNGLRFEGTISEIDEIGRLIIETGEERRVFDVKEVMYVE